MVVVAPVNLLPLPWFVKQLTLLANFKYLYWSRCRKRPMHTNLFCVTFLLQNLEFLFECQRTSSPSKSNLVSAEYQRETSLKVKYVC